MYIIRYLSVQNQMTNTIYPKPGTWEDQEEWYMKAFTIGMNQLNKIRNTKNKGNK